MVIGGGVAGRVMAMALHKAGIQASVYEAYSAAADNIGGMLTVAPNGLDSIGDRRCGRGRSPGRATDDEHDHGRRTRSANRRVSRA